MRGSRFGPQLVVVVVVVVVALGALGCAAAPAGPRGPLRGPGVELAMDFANAPGTATATLADGTVARGNGDNFPTWLTFPPRRLEGRLSPVEWADVGGRIGWLEGEVDARVGLPAREDSVWAFNLAAGLSSGAPGMFVDAKGTRTRWVRLEAYPALSTKAGSTLRLVLAAGVDAGLFFHGVDDPRPSTSIGDGPPSFDPGLPLLRRETRLETSLGLVLHDRGSGSVLFTVSPYFVLDAGAPQSTCPPTSCTFEVVRYQQDWGLVLVMRLALRRAF
jgi:hypothetical protein